MADIQVASKRIQESDLAKFLPTRRLIKEFAALSVDVSETIPTSIDEINTNIELAQEVGATAQALASLASALAQSALSAVNALSDGPPPAPQVAPDPDESLMPQVFALREQLAVLTIRVNNLEEGPRP